MNDDFGRGGGVIFFEWEWQHWFWDMYRRGEVGLVYSGSSMGLCSGDDRISKPKKGTKILVHRGGLRSPLGGFALWASRGVDCSRQYGTLFFGVA